MANSRCPLLLLFLGLLIAPAFLQQHPCELVKNTNTRGTFSLDVSPQTYKPGGIYTVTISGIDNSTSVILQAVDGVSHSEGLWEMENEAVSCSSNEYVIQKNVSGSGTRTRWTSSGRTNAGEVHIRAFVTFANGTTLFQTHTFTTGLTTAVVTPVPSTATHTASGTHRPTILRNATVVTHNWASTHEHTKGPYNSAATSQTLLLATMQFLPIFLGFKLFS